jgi:hypothetical protein
MGESLKTCRWKVTGTNLTREKTMSRANTPVRKLRRQEGALYRLERRKAKGQAKETTADEIATLQARISQAKVRLNISA